MVHVRENADVPNVVRVALEFLDHLDRDIARHSTPKGNTGLPKGKVMLGELIKRNSHRKESELTRFIRTRAPAGH